MIAKKIQNIFLFGLSLLILLTFHCKSRVDQPDSDYNLLALVGKDIVNAFYWDGKSDFSQCTTNNNLLACETYRELYNLSIRNLEKNTFIYADSLQNNGKIDITIVNPENGNQIKVYIPVSVKIEVGTETGNGYGRILVLTNDTPQVVDGITIQLLESKSDILENGLRGYVKFRIVGTNELYVTFSYNLNKIF